MLTPLAALVCVASPAPPTVAELAPILKMICTQAGTPGRLACRDADMAFALKKEGVSLDARSQAAWAATPEQVRAFAQEGKCVIVGEERLLREGASLALVREGRTVGILLHHRNAQASGINLSDALLKLSRPVS